MMTAAGLRDLWPALFEACWRSGLIPSEWRRSLVVPVPKNQQGGVCVADRFRGIALTSVVCKIYCHILRERLATVVDHEEFNLVVEEQGGFRRGRVMSTSIAPTTGGQGESDANAGLVAGVVVGVVLAVVVVVVVVAIVLAVCSTQQRRKRSGQTCDVPVVALSVADDSGIALIRNPAYDELKNLTSSATEASRVQYDYACPTDIAPAVMGHEPSAHDAVLLTPMYEPMLDTPPAKVSINTHTHVQ